MKSFNLDKNGVNNGGIIGGNIVIMRKKLYGVCGPIKCAPNRYMLQEFGGTMTIEEFRKGSTMDTGPRMNEAIQVCPDLIKRIPIKVSTKLSEISNSEGVNEPLRLKRAKPLKRDANNLEKTLGIIRKIPSKTAACLSV